MNFPKSLNNYFMVILQLSQLIKCFQIQSHKLCDISEKIKRHGLKWSRDPINHDVFT